MSTPDHVGIRPTAGLPPGFLPDRFDGLWLDLSRPVFFPDPQVATRVDLGAVAVPTGRFETRENGAVAEAFEVRL